MHNSKEECFYYLRQNMGLKELYVVSAPVCVVEFVGGQRGPRWFSSSTGRPLCPMETKKLANRIPCQAQLLLRKIHFLCFVRVR